MILSATITALSPGLTSSFMASQGTPPYTYAVTQNNSLSTIDHLTGLYTAGNALGTDTITATDSLGITATLKILVGCPLMLLCDIIKTELYLDDDQVYFYNQKFNIPTDSRLYIAVGLLSTKAFGNSLEHNLDGSSVQSVNAMTTCSIDIFSKSTEALFKKEQVVMALRGDYSLSQQAANSFHIAKIPSTTVNLSKLEGTAIPYRFNFSLNIQYMTKFTKPVGYYDTFDTIELNIEN